MTGEPLGPRPSAPPGSVLARLDPSGKMARHARLLRDDAEAQVVTPCAGDAGRYQVVGEIARGGIGVVLKGRDVDLGRDVAMKVLRDEYALSDDVLHRFVEEAQIGGQLQHPGIVPVYELGLRDDRRPFFTMKLVKGHTLATVLCEPDVREPGSRRRLLGIFESVCQTMAYAHTRGVIHRDLKPANVMVGAFGEVLVVDWGMGKVLQQGGVADERRSMQQTVIATVRSAAVGSQSQVGSVYGTPAYMPPEQARGEIDTLDERADVFALGAILCEILTGKPPYVGDELRKAANADLGDAHGRLDACGAGGELTALAKACLAPAAAARPRNAAAVAAEVALYLASLEEKARRAQLEAAAAAVRAEEERRRRRLTVALAASLVALLCVGGGGFYLLEAGRRHREEEARRAVDEAIDEATALRGKAAASGTDPVLWSSAVAAARRADALAASRDADVATRARAGRVLSEMREGARSAEAARATIEREDRLVARLEGIWQDRADHWKRERAEREYEAAFRESGIDPLGPEAPGAIAERIRTSRVAPQIAVALDAWRELRGRHTETAALDALLEAADPDPWRKRLRAADTLEEYRELVREARPDAMPVESLLMLVDRLGQGGDPEGARALALRIQAPHPGSFWANWEAAHWTYESKPRRPGEVIAFLTACVSLRPRSFAARCSLGVAYAQAGDLDAAIEQYRDAIRHCPTWAEGHSRLGDALFDKGDVEEALAECREAVRLEPDSAHARHNLAYVLKGTGQSEAAIAEYREALRLDPGQTKSHGNLGHALQAQGELDAAVAEYREVIRLDPKGALGHHLLATAFKAKGDVEGAKAEWREALRLDPDLGRAHYGLACEIERDDPEGAEAHYRDAIRLDPAHAEAHCNLGGLLRKSGRLEESLEEYRQGHALGSGRKGWPYPSAQWLKDAERLLALETRVDGVLAGTDRPSLADGTDIGGVAFVTGRYVAGATIFARIFEEHPTAARDRMGLASFAARAAALAGTREGKDTGALDAAARAAWRRQAIEWLRVDLLVLRANAERGNAAAAREVLLALRGERDLAGIRGSEELERLPPDEQEACRALWRDAEVLLAELEARR